MGLDQKILAWLDELIVAGQQVLSTRTIGQVSDFVDPGRAVQWGVNCLNLLRRVFGIDSDHYVRFSAEYGNFSRYTAAQRALGILKAAKDDYEKGMLFNARVLIEAEVFDDFLEQADHLLQQGYYQPAVVVAGAVLEDGLRKLCDRNDIPLPDAPKLDTMNADLAKRGVYNKLVQKQVTALADLRNKAAHGQWDQFTKADVANMLQQVRAFMATHFS